MNGGAVLTVSGVVSGMGREIKSGSSPKVGSRIFVFRNFASCWRLSLSRFRAREEFKQDLQILHPDLDKPADL